MSIRLEIYRRTFLYGIFQRCFLFPIQPVLVYQMGKVGSSSIRYSLKKRKFLNVYHFHRLNPKNISRFAETCKHRGIAPPETNSERKVYEKLIIPRRLPVKIITLVREPISRNISAFFQNLEYFERMEAPHDVLSAHQLMADFLEKYNHEVPLRWFDVELKATTGIDVYLHPFPRDLGYQFIESAPFSLLILRHDLDDEIKEKCLCQFLELKFLPLHRRNESSKKAYADKYKAVVDRMKLPSEYVERMVSSPYARHFFPSEELDRIRHRWIST